MCVYVYLLGTTSMSAYVSTVPYTFMYLSYYIHEYLCFYSSLYIDVCLCTFYLQPWVLMYLLYPCMAESHLHSCVDVCLSPTSMNACMFISSTYIHGFRYKNCCDCSSTKSGPIPASFCVYFRSFQTNITIFSTNICEKMSIQYTVLGFEPTTFRTWVSSHNH